MKKKEAVSAGAGSGGAAGDKAVLSSWTVTPGGAWTMRLDLGGANLSNNVFTLVYKFTDTSETQCSARMNGDQNSGTLTTTSCTLDSNGSHSHTVGTVPFLTAGAGSYARVGGPIIQMCKANSTCHQYQ